MTIKNYIHDVVTLAGAAGIVGTAVPALTTRVIKSATICNPTAAPVAASAYLVQSGGAADATTVMISARTLSPGESYPCPELVNQGLNALGAVYALGAGLTMKYTATDFA